MKSPRLRLLLTMIVGASLAAGCFGPALGQQGHNPFVTPEATPIAPDSGTWELVDQRDLGIDGELVALSPDGQHIAGIGPDLNRFCVWNVETSDPTCDEERQPVMQDSITWAPDSSAVAYSLNAHIQLHDSDIFVFELDAGHSVNLTDDGYQGGIPLSEEVEVDELPLDVYPAWTPDGKSLVFARTEWLADQPTTELMTIDRAGGEPEALHTVRDDYPLAVASPVFPLADGSILYSVFVNRTDDPGNGIWRLDPDGEANRLLPGALDERFPLPAITDVRDGEAGAVVSGYSRGLANTMPIMEPMAFEIDLDTGDLTPSVIERDVGSYQMPFAYAPDGASRIAIESRRTEHHLVITGPDGGRTSTTDLGIHQGGRYTNSRGLDWAANDTILVPEFIAGGLLLTVKHRP